MENWYVYILLCDRKTFYVGITDNVRRRLFLHKNKESFFTKKFSDLECVYCEKYVNKYEAAKRERQIKGWSRAKKQMLINGKLGIGRIELAEVLVGRG
jgi:putative endonuclease